MGYDEPVENKKKLSHIKIHVPIKGNTLLEKTLKAVNEDVEIATLWEVINVNAIYRLGMTDHGPVHFQIVSNISIKFVRMLVAKGIQMSVTENYELSSHYAELIVLLTSLFHDLGMSINRDGHEEFSLFLANTILHRILTFLPVKERTIVISETLHAIISHRSGGHPLTMEGGIMRVSDALDMNKGRSRIPYEAGKVDIHSVSAAAIEHVQIREGKDKPIQIIITMNNSAGIFQLDELLKKKIQGSGIEKYISIRAFINQKTEKKLLKEYLL